MLFEISEHGDTCADGERVSRECAGLIDRTGGRDLAHDVRASAVGGNGQAAADDFA